VTTIRHFAACCTATLCLAATFSMACSPARSHSVMKRTSPDQRLLVHIMHDSAYGSEGAVSFEVAQTGSTQPVFRLGQGGSGSVCLASVAWSDRSDRVVVLIVPCFRTPFVSALDVRRSGLEQAPRLEDSDWRLIERQIESEYGSAVEGSVMAWVKSSKAWSAYEARISKEASAR
jgi:hypothetical protein